MEIGLGVAVRMFMTAQVYWAPNKRPVPNAIYDKLLGAEIWLKLGLARRIRGGTYICGSRENFAWLLQKHDASRKGVESRRNSATVRSSESTVRQPSSPLLSTHAHSTQTRVESITPRLNPKRHERGLKMIEEIKKLSEAKAIEAAKDFHDEL